MYELSTKYKGSWFTKETYDYAITFEFPTNKYDCSGVRLSWEEGDKPAAHIIDEFVELQGDRVW